VRGTVVDDEMAAEYDPASLKLSPNTNIDENGLDTSAPKAFPVDKAAIAVIQTTGYIFFITVLPV
jgi:hypothetical protein